MSHVHLCVLLFEFLHSQRYTSNFEVLQTKVTSLYLMITLSKLFVNTPFFVYFTMRKNSPKMLPDRRKDREDPKGHFSPADMWQITCLVY